MMNHPLNIAFRYIIYSFTLLLFFNGVGRDDIPLRMYFDFSKDSTFNCIGEVYYVKGNTFSLSCVLIDNKHLLSAAHGYYLDSDSLVNDSVMVIDKKYPTKRPAFTYLADKKLFYFLFTHKKYYAKNITVHPGYNSEFASYGYNDIAIIELTEPIDFIKPARLYTDSGELGSHGIACGFGASSKATGGGLLSFTKRRKMAGENMVDSLGGNLIGNQWGVLFADMDHPRTSDCNRMGSAIPLPLEWRSDGGDCGSGLFILQDNQWCLAGISFGPSYFADWKIYGPKYGYYGFIDGWTRISPLSGWIAKNTR